jgi:POT family proton-dependent oligopeptide transporter
VLWGGILIACGHYAVAVPTAGMTWVGLGGQSFLLMVIPTSGHSCGDYLMSLWFLSLALANGIQAQTVKLYDEVSKPAYFGVDGAIAVIAGLALMAATRRLRRTMHPVH